MEPSSEDSVKTVVEAPPPRGTVTSDKVRTLHEVIMDVRFSARYNMLVERWYLLLNDATTLVGLLLFSSVIFSLYRQVEWIAASAAGVGALLQAINLTLGSVRKAQAHRELYKQYQELDAKLSSGTMMLPEAEEAYRRLEMQDPATSSRFARIAHRDNLKTHGYVEETAKAEKALGRVDRLIRTTLG